jgi:hypothetical protein
VTARRAACTLAVLVVSACAVAVPASAQPDRSTGATITVTPSSVGIGQVVLVALSGWPRDIATVNLCGNLARRGSQDCDQLGSASTAVGPGQDETVAIYARTPPVGCPCVVRAEGQSSHAVATAPITVAGVATGTDLAPAVTAVDPRDVTVTAHIAGGKQGWPRAWFGPFAAPTDRVLVLEIANHSSVAITGLRVAGLVGRHDGTGEPIDQNVHGAIAPGAARTVDVSFVLAAPAYGSYTVSGRIYGLAVPVGFSVKTRNEPWGLELLIPVVLFAIAQLVRHRRRLETRSVAAAVPTVTAPAVATEAAVDGPVPGSIEFPQCSPVVGAPDDPAWRVPSYDASAVAAEPVAARGEPVTS